MFFFKDGRVVMFDDNNKIIDKNFPENNNIKYSNDNKCQVMEDNCWQEKDIALLSTNLMKDNIVYNKSDNQRYNDVLAKIKEMIKNSVLEFEN